jgi:hypothetical protein
VRQGTGERLEKAVEGEKVVTLDTLKPLIDDWIKGAAKEVERFVKPH